MAITYLAISYPNFILGAIIDPYEVNINNSEITDKVNYVIDDINKATLDISALTLNKADKTYVNSEISRIDTKFTTSIASNVNTLNATIVSNVNTLNSTISNVNSTLDGKITNLAGTGRTTQTVKGNADALITHKISSDHDARYTTKTELTGGALDGRYYTKTLLDGGQLDNRYFTESELSSSSGASIIGNTSFDGSPITVQQSLEWLKSQIDGVAIGTIPDGSVMDIKLSGEPTQILGRLNSHIATTNAHISTTNTHISNTNVHVTSAEKTSIGTIGSKVDKVSGKGLSTNDYTTAEKTKLAGLPVDAVNAIYSGTSFTDPNTTQISMIVTSHENSPNSLFYWYIQTMFYSTRTGSRGQIALSYHGASEDMYYRRCYQEVWTPWRKIYSVNNLTKADIGLGSVQNYPIATTAQAQAGTSNAVYMTPLRVAESFKSNERTINKLKLSNKVLAGTVHNVSIPIGSGKTKCMFTVANTVVQQAPYWKEVYTTTSLSDVFWLDSFEYNRPPSYKFSTSSTTIVIVPCTNDSVGSSSSFANTVVGFLSLNDRYYSLGLRNPKIVGTNLTFEIFNTHTAEDVTENCTILWEAW